MATTIIGKSLVIDGEISGDEALVIEGTVKGKIGLSESVRVSPSAVVQADIETTTVSISGQVTGNIHATTRVEITADGRMIGDVRAPRITIADGATFKGNVDMDL
jgi:cytoskeletal protein CcmA (bactofilin family)